MQGAKAPVEKMNPITMVVAQTNLAQMIFEFGIILP